MEDIIIKRDTANLGMLRKEVIQVISELGQAKSFVQAENHLDYLIRAKRLTHLKRLGRVVSAQATTTERSQICVSQQYRWHMMIEEEWEDLRRENSPRLLGMVYTRGSLILLNVLNEHFAILVKHMVNRSILTIWYSFAIADSIED